MTSTSFCHLLIISDAKHKLYKSCGYVIKSCRVAVSATSALETSV
uniref:INO80 complex subunit D n=1 Tax=Rhizophora mucronata TaxID=61149 RepID=A0A2P2M0X4_RHIMU